MSDVTGPTVSINLCCYNGEKYLDETLDSLVGQDYPGWELVIVDDGSTDSTAAIVARYCRAGHPIRHHRQQNRGLGHARNQALALSKGSFIAFADQDDVWHRSKLSLQMPRFDNPDVGLVYSEARIIDSLGNPQGLFSDSDQHRLVRGNARESLLTFGGFLCLSTALVRKTCIDQVGGFNADFRIVEDTDMWFRIADIAEFDYCPEPLVSYRVHPSSGLRSRPDRHWDEAITVMCRELRRGRMSEATRRRAVDRLLSFVWEKCRALQREGRWKESMTLAYQSAAFDRLHSARWLLGRMIWR